MFCSNCSNEIKAGLRYCNNCGYQVEEEVEVVDGKIAKQIAMAVGWIGVIGLVAFIFVLKILLEEDVMQGALVAISFLYLATVFGICAIALNFIKSAGGVRKQKKESRNEPLPLSSGETSKRLEPARTPPAASVTDHTTRALEEIPFEAEK